MSVLAYQTGELEIFQNCNKECGIITASDDQQYFSLNCLFCSEKFLYFDAFITHIQTDHASLQKTSFPPFFGGDGGARAVPNNQDYEATPMLDEAQQAMLEPQMVMVKEERMDDVVVQHPFVDDLITGMPSERELADAAAMSNVKHETFGTGIEMHASDGGASESYFDNDNDYPDPSDFIDNGDNENEQDAADGSVNDDDDYNDDDLLEEALLDENVSAAGSESGVNNKKWRQKLRNEGKRYTSSTGKIVPERNVRSLEPCRKKCREKVSLTDQHVIHNQYWQLGAYNLRQSFLAGLIEIEETKSARKIKSATNTRRRELSYKYFLEVNGKRISVCQKCFRFTLCETEQFIKTLVKKKSEGSTTRWNNSRKISSRKENEVIKFINRFPSYESHYNRRDTSKRYLSSDLSVAELHRLYCANFRQPLSLSKFSSLFNTLNFKFKKPVADICHKCDLLKSKIDVAKELDLETLKLEQTEHHYQAERADESKKLDKEKALADASVKVFSFDLQQCLPTPFLRTSLYFDKRPLWTFNLTVHDCSSNQPVCYMWHEALANRGANEIASCVFSHLQNLESSVKQVIFYSDCCSSHNQNSFIATMFAIFMQFKNNVSMIDYKFIVAGHTHMECDIDHALIERKKKNTTIQIHHPRDWYQFVRTVEMKKNKFVVNEMHQSNFLDFAHAAKELFSWRKVDSNGQKYNWRNIKWLRFNKEYGTILYKNSLTEEEPFKLINIRKRGINCIQLKDLKTCYQSPIKISSKKKKDLLEMLSLVDDIYKNFYNDLKTQDMLDYHADLTEIDDENDD